jgi:hypothetical protein
MLGKIARLFGVVFVVVGALGFVPPLVPDGNLVGLFHVNAVHNVVHIALGLWGIAAGGSGPGSLLYFRGLTVIYALLAVLGSVKATETLFGLAPVGGYNVWLHGALTIAAAYFGFGPPSRTASKS